VRDNEIQIRDYPKSISFYVSLSVDLLFLKFFRNMIVSTSPKEHCKGTKPIPTMNRVKVLQTQLADDSDIGRQTPTGQIDIQSQINRYK
jgi:hypothetical protein